MTLERLLEVMPRLPRLRASVLLEPLNLACEEFDIITPLRRAAFLGQIAHESNELRNFEELASGEAYEARKDLGNTEVGDGKRFKGRGPIQLTGRSNYREAGKALGINLELNPRRASDSDVAFRVAGWFWKSRGLNRLADFASFDEITRRINGGLNGRESRWKYYERALAALGCAPVCKDRTGEVA